MRRFKANTFYCFSAPVMLATFFIEIALAIYVFATRKFDKTVLLAGLLLIHLGLFQLAEYGICESWGFSSPVWSRIGFVVITFLPAYGLHLVNTVAKQKMSALIPAAYIAATIWSLIFVFGSIPHDAVCSGNYIIFRIPEPHEGLYYLYYNITIAVSIAFAYLYSTKTTIKNIKIALRSLIVGYLTFIVPSIIFNIFDSYVGIDSPLPSIMCGFAVLFAIILATFVVPYSTDKREKKTN